MENKKNLEEVLGKKTTEIKATKICGYCERPIRGEGYKDPETNYTYCDTTCCQWDNESDN